MKKKKLISCKALGMSQKSKRNQRDSVKITLQRKRKRTRRTRKIRRIRRNPKMVVIMKA